MESGSFRNLVKGLIEYGQIKTTLARAKLIQRKIDHLVSLARKKTLAARRQVFSALGDKKLAYKLVDQIAAGFGERRSGFTRIIKIGPRKGDGALMAKIEFLEWVAGPVVQTQKEEKAELAEEAKKKPAPKRTQRKVLPKTTEHN